jgi:hypothetical protein
MSEKTQFKIDFVSSSKRWRCISNCTLEIYDLDSLFFFSWNFHVSAYSLWEIDFWLHFNFELVCVGLGLPRFSKHDKRWEINELSWFFDALQKSIWHKVTFGPLRVGRWCSFRWWSSTYCKSYTLCRILTQPDFGLNCCCWKCFINSFTRDNKRVRWEFGNKNSKKWSNKLFYSFFFLLTR